MQNKIIVPKHYRPWPHQAAAWRRQMSGDYDIYIKPWSRQSGKDTSDQQVLLRKAWDNPGSQSVYIGLDNIWVRDNIFNKYIDGRLFWDDYPAEIIDPKDTKREVYMHNGGRFDTDLAPAHIKYIGLLNEKGVIGSSFRNWVISEAGLYPVDKFNYILPIWRNLLARGIKFSVSINGTPRGVSGSYWDLLRMFTGVDDPALFPGEHVTPYGRCYVDLVTADQVLVPLEDAPNEYRPLFTEEQLEDLRQEHIRLLGNDALFRQEYFCDFITSNAGAVYQGIANLRSEGRYMPFNVNPEYPVGISFDVASAKKTDTPHRSDATAAVIFQYYEGMLRVLDVYEAHQVSLIEAMREMQSQRPWFKYLRQVILPWDTENYQTSLSPAEELKTTFNGIFAVHVLGQTKSIFTDINIARLQLPNTYINSTNCEYMMQCFDNYEYKRMETLGEWGRPIHNWASHLMDAWRYCCVGVKEIDFMGIKFGKPDRGMKKVSVSMLDAVQGMFPETKRTKGNPIYMTDEQRKQWAKEQAEKDITNYGF